MRMHKLGIIAGSGLLPREIIKYCKLSNKPYFVIAIKGQAEPSLVLNKIPHKWLRLGEAGKIIKLLRLQNVTQLVMAGSIKRPSLKDLNPDIWTVKFFAKTGAAILGDDGLLSSLCSVLHEQEGFDIIAPDELLPELLTKEGIYGLISPSAENKKDILTGVAAALELGSRDLGQAAVVRNREVIGLEDWRGTDSLLKDINPSSNCQRAGVLVKVSKPKQDRRIDLPTIGPNTIINVKNSGLCGIAIESGHSFILDKKHTIESADKKGLFIFGIST